MRLEMDYQEASHFTMFVSGTVKETREDKIETVTELFSLDIELLSVVQFFATKCQGQELLHADALWLFLWITKISKSE